MRLRATWWRRPSASCVAALLLTTLLIATAGAQAVAAPAKQSPATATSSNVQYRGGPVAPSLNTYSVYWEPQHFKMSTTYKSVINSYFANVAADSGKTSNVYALTEQYSDSQGAVARYSDSFGGQIVDTTAFPAGGCTAPNGAICLSNIQIKNELEKIAAQRTRGLGTMYSLFLPRGVEICGTFESYPKAPRCTFDSDGICAYHSWDVQVTPNLFFDVVPYPVLSRGCDNDNDLRRAGPRPNGNVADAAVSLISHETLEAVTDPYGVNQTLAAWSGPAGEIGDPCLKSFGAPLAGGSRAKMYNQVINGARYYIQEEWSNRQSSCEQRPPTSGVQPPTASFTVGPTNPKINTQLSFDASGSSTPTGLFASYAWDFGDGASGSGPWPTHVYTTPGTYTVRLVATDSDSLIGATTRTVAVGSGGPVVTTIGTGGFHACGVLSTGGIGCWGRNDYGQLGNGALTCSRCANPDPTAVGSMSTATSVSGGVTHTCARLSSGSVDCWGGNTYGQLGQPSPDVSTSPVQATSVANATEVSAGGFHTCALLSDETIECWGNNQHGQLGTGSVSCATCANPAPSVVGGIPNATAIAAGVGSYDTCALLADHSIDCWGDNQYGQLGNNATTDSASPVQVSGITNASAVTAGYQHACALLADRTVECWGNNDYGQLGNNTTTSSTTPVQVSGITSAVAITAGYQHTCAILASGTVECWGDDQHGQLGDGLEGSGIYSKTPALAGGLPSAATQIVGGGYHTCTLLSDGSLYCWGRNDFGQLGHGDTNDSPTPVPVGVIP